mmetsp:Transcript_34353/g.97589  ORF Transcript_34353/g.97589 Transcript_34353/m.97589 type:complete len:217 (-) Transcript_34353:309-959(-)
MCLCDIQVQGLEVCHHSWVLQVILELVPGQGAGLVDVCLPEEAQDALLVLGHALHLGSHDDLAVALDNLGRRRNEGADDHVQDAEQHEEDVRKEERLVEHLHLPQRLHQVAPIRTARDGHEQRDHRPVDAAPPLHQPLAQLGVLSLAVTTKPISHSGDDEDCKDVHIEHNEDQAPEQRRHRCKDRVQDRSQALQVPHHPRNPHQPGEPRQAQQPAE